ncbi:MAG: hypothetical protein ACXIUD_08455 [Mongoliitalea sp.]
MENFFGSTTISSRSNSGNTQPVGIVIETPDGVGPMETGTTGNQIGGIINADLPSVKSPPSGGFMEKIANALGGLLEGLFEFSPPTGQDSNNETEPATSESSKTKTTNSYGGSGNSDSTFIKNTGKLHPDGTVSIKVLVGDKDTIDFKTKNVEDSKRLRDDPNVKWNKN